MWLAWREFSRQAGHVLSADWGADVIKIEHPVRGDAQRGFLRMGSEPFRLTRNPVQFGHEPVEIEDLKSKGAIA